MFFGKTTFLLVRLFSIFFFGGTMLMCTSTNTIQHTVPLDYDINIIPEDELLQRMLDALSGDPDAASSVENHYAYGVHDDYESIKWLNIGAENGDGEAQYALANILLNYSIDFESKTRGIFWLHRMVQNEYRKTETNAWLQRLGYTINTARPPDDSRFSDYSKLSDTGLADCKTGALQGNKKAAVVAGKYYEGRDRDLSEYWYRIGAQNGSPECQYIFGQILIKKNGQFDQIRGKFWLDQSSKNGYKAN
jgi:hypothetical protein